jgi:hypothetical protein
LINIEFAEEGQGVLWKFALASATVASGASDHDQTDGTRIHRKYQPARSRLSCRVAASRPSNASRSQSSRRNPTTGSARPANLHVRRSPPKAGATPTATASSRKSAGPYSLRSDEAGRRYERLCQRGPQRQFLAGGRSAGSADTADCSRASRLNKNFLPSCSARASPASFRHGFYPTCVGFSMRRRRCRLPSSSRCAAIPPATSSSSSR